MQSGTATNIASEYDAMKVSHKYLEIGADVIYGGNWSYKIIRGVMAVCKSKCVGLGIYPNL